MITTATFTNKQPHTLTIRSLVRRSWNINRSLTVFIVVCLALTVVGAIAILIDPRTINGQSVWTKPTKFGISNAIYSATILAIFSSINPRPRWVNWLFNFTSATLATGMFVIASQAARGTTSHYNLSTTYDTIMLSIMGLSTLTLSVVSLVGCILLVRHAVTSDTNTIDRSVVWGVKLGVVITILVGFGVGNLMLLPTESQLANAQSGGVGAGSIIGAHTVGADDGGPGLPFLGWSTTHGDLRPAHFFGLHALQIVPLLGLFVARRREQWLTQAHRLSIVVIGAFAYAGFIVLTTWQALQAEPIMYPSAETLIALATLVGTTLFATGATLLHARRAIS